MISTLIFLALSFQPTQALSISKCNELQKPADRNKCVNFAKTECSPHETYFERNCAESSPNEQRIQGMLANVKLGKGYQGGTDPAKAACFQNAKERAAQNIGCAQEMVRCTQKKETLSVGEINCNDFEINSGKKVCIALEEEKTRITAFANQESNQCAQITGIDGATQ